MPEISITEHAVTLLELITRTGFASSKSEARRLIEQGGVRVGEIKKTDPQETISVDDGMIVQVGPRKFAKIIRA